MAGDNETEAGMTPLLESKTDFEWLLKEVKRINQLWPPHQRLNEPRCRQMASRLLEPYAGGRQLRVVENPIMISEYGYLESLDCARDIRKHAEEAGDQIPQWNYWVRLAFPGELEDD